MHPKVVFNGSKILIRKQITTTPCHNTENACCFQWFKDTNSKANHNYSIKAKRAFSVVFNGSKILIRKQITTPGREVDEEAMLFSMVQRY